MAQSTSLIRTTALLWACVLISVAFALSCGDDDGGSPDPSGTSSPTSSSAANGSATPEPTAEASETPTQAPLSGAPGELRSLIETWLAGVNAKVTYDYVSNFGGHPDGIYTTYFLDGADRHDWENIGAGLGVTQVTIVNGDEAYVCSIFESNPTCNVRTPEDTLAHRIAILIVYRTLETISDRADTLSIAELPDEQIAGLDAQCFETTSGDERLTEGPPAVEVVVTCFSEDGLLLRVDHDVLFEEEEVLPDGDLVLEATDIGQAVPDDFEPPARVIEGS